MNLTTKDTKVVTKVHKGIKMNVQEIHKKFLDKDKMINFVFLSAEPRVPLW